MRRRIDGAKVLVESRLRCDVAEPMAWAVGVLVLCDRKPRHSGKHMHRSVTGRTEWWKAHTVTHSVALGIGGSDEK